MTQYRKILGLHSQGISQRIIANSVNWPLPSEMTDAKLQKLLHVEMLSGPFKMPDYEQAHREMAKSGVTLSLLWSEYCERCRQNVDVPFMYTQFCKYYRDYAAVNKATMLSIALEK